MFATALYRQLALSPGNLFCSPYSIGSALAMLEAGAGGATRTELRAALGQADPVETYAGLARELARRSQPTPVQLSHLKYMEGATPDVFGCRLIVANSLWRQTGYAVEQNFVTTLRSKLGVDIGEVDFRGAPAEAARAINAWAAASTHDKIRDVLSERLIDPMTRVILANAIYFKARWDDEFSEYGTKPAPFTLPEGKRVEVPTMHTMGYRNSSRDGALRALSLPYSGKALAMIVLLPDAG